MLGQTERSQNEREFLLPGSKMDPAMEKKKQKKTPDMVNKTHLAEEEPSGSDTGQIKISLHFHKNESPTSMTFCPLP